MELYVIATVDPDGNITGFPKIGGTPISSFIWADETEDGARQALNRLSFVPENAKIVRILDAEVIGE